MVWLVLDTAYPQGIVGICDEDKVLHEEVLLTQRKHAENLNQAVENCLRAAKKDFGDLTILAVGCGPGSFVGIRIAIAFAKGVCLARGIPLVGLSSLVAIARQEGLPSGRGLVAMDARKAESYVLAFKRLTKSGILEVKIIDAHLALTPEKIKEKYSGFDFIVGNGPFEGPFGHHEPLDGPRASGLCQALKSKIAGGVIDETLTLAPNYCREPAAKKMLER